MKAQSTILKSIVLVLALFSTALSAEKAPRAVVELANTRLMGLGTDPVVVESVRSQNARGMRLDQIKERDRKWMATPGIDDFMKGLMTSECGQYLRRLQKETPYYAEIFVMDHQGALVAATNKTSDYWQGDESKFTQSYNQGYGGIHISDVEFDESAQAYLVQVSVPVKDDGEVIGALTVGIDLDEMEGAD